MEPVSDRILRMIREVDRGFAKPAWGLRFRIFVTQLWAYFILGATLVIVFVNTYIVNFGRGYFAELSFVVATGSMVFAFMSGFYTMIVASTIEDYHSKRLRANFAEEDFPLLTAIVRMRYQTRTKLEPLYWIDRSMFTRRALVRRLSESRLGFFAVK